MTDAPSTQPTAAKGKGTVFAARLLSTVLLWSVVATIVIIKHPLGFFLVIGGLALIALREFYAMARTAGIGVFAGFGMLAAALYCVGLYAALFLQWQAADGEVVDQWHVIDGLALCVVLFGAFVLQLRQPVRGSQGIVAVAVTALGFVYIVVLFNFLVRLMFVPPDNADFVAGAMLAVWLVAVTKFTDMGAYLVGTMIGKHKMIPHISPGKTWQGFGGALVFALLAGVGLYALMPAKLAILTGYGHVIFLSVLLGLFSVVGDLAESLLKRGLDAKDSGKSLPGIGGALDLIDSLCFTAPVLFFYVVFVLP